MASNKLTVTVTIKKWAKPVLFLFVLLGLRPRRWMLNIEGPKRGI
jgi:hypothetical protein